MSSSKPYKLDQVSIRMVKDVNVNHFFRPFFSFSQRDSGG